MHDWIKKFKKNKISMGAFCIVIFFALMGLYAPFLASSKPFVVRWQGHWYFPFFRHLFFPGFYTKPIDLFYNLLMFTLPLAIIGSLFLSRFGKRIIISFLLAILALQLTFFMFTLGSFVKDPKADYELTQKREKALTKRDYKQEDPLTASFAFTPTWQFELAHMNDYQKLDILIKEQLYKKQHQKLIRHLPPNKQLFTKWALSQKYEQEQMEELENKIKEKQGEYEEAKATYGKLLPQYQPLSHALILAKHALKEGKIPSLQNQENDSAIRSALESARFKIENYLQLQGKLRFLRDKRNWIALSEKKLSFMLSPPLRSFHWEENAGGHAQINSYLPWYEVSRSNRKDLAASLLFGLRISFLVGTTAVALSLLIGGGLGMIAGYFAGKVDLWLSRAIEIWEAMPTFFMLLLIVAITQSKSIFLVIFVLGLFGWTNFARFMRAEALKQRNLSYAVAAKALGYNHITIMRSEILPNAIAPLLTLLPFAMMVAISSEAGLSFLGLGEEGSSSLGVLMDEGRHAFPGESYLLWPAATLLTFLLIAIALVGDGLRDAIDPKTN